MLTEYQMKWEKINMALKDKMPSSRFTSLEDNFGSCIFSSNVTPNIYLAYYENVFLFLGLYVTVSPEV